MAKDDGGPAFPVHEQWNEWSDLKAEYVPRSGPRGGMSLRDYFAAKALAGICGDGIPGGHHRAEATAREAYAYADAMLAERGK